MAPSQAKEADNSPFPRFEGPVGHHRHLVGDEHLLAQAGDEPGAAGGEVVPALLPVVDLVAIPYMVEGLVAVFNGNMAKVIVTGAIWFSVGLLMCTYTAPLFTEVAKGAGYAIPAGAAMITSFNI